eukprot:jgi/Hompol1/2575/HPOL_006056-RA
MLVMVFIIIHHQILIDLPDTQARKAMFMNLLPKHQEQNHDDAQYPLVGDLDYDVLANATQGYAGSDINLVCREAAMRPLRAIFEKLE